MMLLILKSQQQQPSLFDAPIMIGQHVRKDGTVVKPYTRTQKVRPKDAPRNNKPASIAISVVLRKWLDKHGGLPAVAAMIAEESPAAQAKMIDLMAHVGRITTDKARELLGSVKAEKKSDLFGSSKNDEERRDLFSSSGHNEDRKEDGDTERLLAEIPGAKWRRGKGMVDGYYGIEIDGDIVGNFHAKPEIAISEAKQILEKIAQDRKDAETRSKSIEDIRDRLLGGGSATEKDLELLGLRSGSSGLKWFIPAAAQVFGVSSRDVRPYIKDLIRIGHTDMGNELEYVEPRKALAAIAEGLAGHRRLSDARREMHRAREDLVSGEIAGLELRHQNGLSWALILPDASNPGGFRYQVFDANGIQGHATFNSARDALDGAWAAGYREKDKGAIDRIFSAATEKSETAGDEFVTPPARDLPIIEHDGDKWHVQAVGAARGDKVYAHLTSATRGRQQKNGVQPVGMADWIDRSKVLPETEDAHEIVEHITKRGKTIRGIVRKDLTQDEAKAIDEYTFRKDGGWFIREKYLSDAQPKATAVSAADDGERVDQAKGSRYRYAMVNRPAGIGTVPSSGFIAAEDRPAKGDAHHDIARNGVAVFDRKLSDEETARFEMAPMVGEDDAGEFVDAVVSKMGRYAKKYLAMDSVKFEREVFERLKSAVKGYQPSIADRAAFLQMVRSRIEEAVAPDQSAQSPSFGVPAGTSKADRRRINAEAIEQLDRDNPDHAILRQYSGNGGVGDSLNEYYTDHAVAKSIWDVIGRMGINGGTALEPSCATGVFIHTAPEGFRVTGVELDSVSARIATVLHGSKHEIVNASLERFATTDDRQFDVVIGNPPYGPRGYLIKDDKKDISTAEQYFTDTALDKTKPGGIIALVVPTGIMDSTSGRAFRENLLRKGQFLGAMRMPNTAFEHAHTEVTTDVIFMRKRGDDVAGALSTVNHETLRKLNVWDDEFVSGSYFVGRGSGNVLGTMTDGWRSKAGMGNDITVNGSMAGVPDAIKNFEPDPVSAGHGVTVQAILENLDTEKDKERAISAAKRVPYEVTAKPGDTKTVDGVTYVLQGDPARWHRVDEFMQSEVVTAARALAVEIDGLMAGEKVDHSDLTGRLQAFVARHGIPVDNPHLMAAAKVDRTLYRLIGAIGKKGEISDAVSGRGGAKRFDGDFDAVAQALALEHESGEFSLRQLAERLSKDSEETLDHLIADSRYAWCGGDRWAPMSTYLTGDLWEKLDAAKALIDSGEADKSLQGKLLRQIERLEALIDPRSLEDVDFQINSAFLPLHAIEAWIDSITEKLRAEHPSSQWYRDLKPAKVTFSGGVYSVSGGTMAGGILEKYLNRTGVRKDDMHLIDTYNEDFKQWLCASPLRGEMEDIYNRNFRGYVAQDYSDDPIDVPGLANGDKVRSWRWSGLRRALALGKGITADDVGLGKTLHALLLSRMAKIQGKAKKPVIVVPKSVLANWYAETQQWFPGSKVLTIGATLGYDKDGKMVGKDDKADERKRKYHDLTQNDYDFILISQPAFEEIDLDPETKSNYYDDDFWVQRGDSLGNAGDKRRKAIKERYEQHLATREFDKRTDAIYFNELGVDLLIQDEGHSVKNLYSARSRFGEQPKFLGGQGLSNRALDFNLKSRWVRKNNGGKGVYLLTATPTKNSPLEIYSMLSHVAPEEFERIGVRNSEEFLDRFAEFTRDNVLSTKGDIEDALVTAGFKNMDEMRTIMAKFIDRRTAEQVGLKLPQRQDKMHLVEMSRAQQDVYGDLRELAEKSAGKRDTTGDSHIFAIMDKMAKAALDLSLLGDEYRGEKSPKIDAAATEIAKLSKSGGQIVFCESIDTHDKIIDALVAKGVKRNEIGVINAKAAGSAIKRQNIADDFNSGKLKVVIGNCTMAEGMNLQKGTTDIHHLDVPWEPATLQQRNGRGLRQGNASEAVRIHTYLTKGSFDGYRYQSMSAKRDWQDLLWSGGDRLENLAREGNVSTEEMRIMLSADPDAARAKYEGDKAAALQRHAAGERAKAMSEYARYQQMWRSYKEIKNKGAKSADALRRKMEAIKDGLSRNPHFPSKSALDAGDDLIIEPDSGAVFRAGVGVDTREDGRMVVVSVSAKNQTVTMRHYAAIGGVRHVTAPLSRLKEGVTTFEVDENSEAQEVSRQLEEQAVSKVGSLKSWDDLKSLPSSVLSANHDTIQRQMKAGAKDYSFRFGHGRIPMIDRVTRQPIMVASYDHQKMGDTHDYILPTEDGREAAIQGWMDSERNKVFEQTTFRRHKNSRPEWRNQVGYVDADYNQRQRNPWSAFLSNLEPAKRSGLGAVLVGTGLLEKAKARFKREQSGRIRRAGDFKSAVREGLASAEMPEYGVSGSTVPAWDRRALAALWAKAKRLNVMDSSMDTFMPKNDRGLDVHQKFAVGAQTNQSLSVRDNLILLARKSGHSDLADAMAAMSPTGGNK